MLKKVLIVAAILIASPTIVSAQVFLWSFDSTSAVTSTAALPGSSGTAYIFSDGLFGFNAVDLDFSVSDSSVLLLTDGVSYNNPFDSIGGTAFDSSVLVIDTDRASGSLFSVNVTQNGVDPALTPDFNPHFEAGVGPNGAVLLASVNYDVVGAGSADLNFSLNLGDSLDPVVRPVPPLGSATIVGVPEPSALALLMLGCVGLVARRNRS